jgi:hypothetical protein
MRGRHAPRGGCLISHSTKRLILAEAMNSDLLRRVQSRANVTVLVEHMRR